MSTNLSSEIARLIALEFANGRYRSEEELLAEAVQLLGQRDRLRDQIAAGSQQLAAGKFTDYDSESLRKRFDDLKAGKSFRAQ